MLVIFQSLFKTTQSSIVFVKDSALEAFLWNFFLILLIIGGLIIGALILYFSKKTDDWEHMPIKDDLYAGGRLHYYANSIRYSPLSYADHSPIKNQIMRLFFEKVRAIHGISTNELVNIKVHNQKKFRELINDKEISDWIYLTEKKDQKKGFFDFLKVDRDEEKKNYINEVNRIIDKMETWGE